MSQLPAAIAEQQQATVGEARGQVDVVQGCRDAGAVIGALPEYPHDIYLVLRVKMVRRLVEQENVGLLRQYLGDSQPLALATGQRQYVPVGETVEVHGLQ